MRPSPPPWRKRRLTMARRRYFFTPEMDSVIRDRYDSSTEVITTLAQLYSMPRWVIRKRAADLGVSRQHPGDYFWTPAEVHYLEENLGIHTPRYVAKKLKRTPTAVVLKAKRLGASRGLPFGYYTATGLSECFGVKCSKTVTSWIQEGLLKAKRRGTERTERNGGDMWMISEADVKAFIRKNPLRFDIRKVDQLWFIDILTGVNTNGNRNGNEKGKHDP